MQGVESVARRVGAIKFNCSSITFFSETLHQSPVFKTEIFYVSFENICKRNRCFVFLFNYGADIKIIDCNYNFIISLFSVSIAPVECRVYEQTEIHRFEKSFSNQKNLMISFIRK